MPDPEHHGRQIQQLINLEIPASVRLCEKHFTLGEVLALRPGALLEFPTHHDARLDLYLNGCPVGRGYAADLEDSLGFVVESIDAAAREECLRGSP